MVGRVALAALFLTLFAILFHKPWRINGNARHFLILGLINSALPFFLYAYSAHWLNASIMSVLNATAPIWGILIGALFYSQRLTPPMTVGLLFGVVGVAVLVGFDPSLLNKEAYWAVVAGTGAACCYGIATHYTRRAPAVDPLTNAQGSMWAATFWLLPLTVLFPLQAPVQMPVAFALLALGILCTGIAYLLYFGLVRDIGATSTLTVTFMIPVFGVLWGHLFLAEPIGWQTYVGTCLVLLGTALVTGFRLTMLWQQNRTSD